MGKTRLTAFELALSRGHQIMRRDGAEPCIGHADIFFPDRRKPGSVELIATAKRLCAGCHRAFECRMGAELREEPDGIWGGLDCFERFNPAAKSSREWRRKRTDRKRRARAEATATEQCGTRTGYGAHYLRGETPCDDCRRVNAEAVREWKARRNLA